MEWLDVSRIKDIVSVFSGMDDYCECDQGEL
jgi:hypothetical protein